MRRAIQRFEAYRSEAIRLAEKHNIPVHISIAEPEAWYVIEGFSSVANHYGVHEDWLMNDRSRKATDIRHSFVFVVVRHFEITPLRVAQVLNSSHTTISNAIDKVQDLLDINDALITEFVEEINDILNA